MSKIIKSSDFNNDGLFEDDIFLEVNAGSDDDINVQATTSWTCATSGSLIHSLSSLVSLSDPSNTYSEVDCC